MRLVRERYTYLQLEKNEPNIIFIYAHPGFGKTLTIESFIEEFYRLGYVIFVLADVKDEIELGYAMFPPKKSYHLNFLRRIGKPIESKNVKLYHPFTFNIPKNRALPEINFYGFSFKELGSSEWGMLAETSFESDTIRILMNTSTIIDNSEGLYSFLHNVEDNILGGREKKGLRKPDPKTFFLRTGTATAKSLKDIASYFLPFKKHYFLVPDNSPLKLDWKSIINDNENYHIFTTYWIPEQYKKLKHFTTMALFNAILRNVKYAKKPILIVIPEIRYLVPLKSEGYSKFLAESIKKNITIMRAMGRGISGIFDSQVWSDVHSDIKNTVNVTFFGELGGANDIESLSKANRYSKTISDQLRSMEVRNRYFWQGREDLGTFSFWLPSHCHKEPEYNFFEMYKLHFPERMRDYNNLIEMMEQQFKMEEDKIKEKIKRRTKKDKEIEEEMKKRREERQRTSKVKELEDKAKQIINQSKEDKKKMIYEFKLENPNMSNRQIALKFNVHHRTIGKWLKEKNV